MINKFNIFRKYIKKWQKHRQLSCFFNLFGIKQENISTNRTKFAHVSNKTSPRSYSPNSVQTSARLTFIKSSGASLTCKPRTPALT